MKFKLICCEVFLREACLLLANSKNMVDPVFLPKGAHENPDSLRTLIQDEINKVKEENNYDAVLLGYGLCGNVALGLKPYLIPLVVPRAHDCCSILLGSGKRFLELFGDNLSQRWTSAGYMERGKSYFKESEEGKNLGLDKEFSEFVEIYGEDNAQFIWDTLHPKIDESNLVYIEIPETAHLGLRKKAKSKADEEGKSLVVLDGTIEMLRGLIDGDWAAKSGDGDLDRGLQEEGATTKSLNYLVVQPHEIIEAVYDYEEVMKSTAYVD